MKTRINKLMSKTLLFGPALEVIPGAGRLAACTDNGKMEGRNTAGTISQEISESGSEEGNGANLGLDETFDAVRGGARLILNFDAACNTFSGTAENTTSNILRVCRQIEVKGDRVTQEV